jgi:hypothetical protein
LIDFFDATKFRSKKTTNVAESAFFVVKNEMN